MNLTVAITGASGAIFGQSLLRMLEADPRVNKVHFLASENSLRVMAEELSISGRNQLLERLLGHAPRKTTQHVESDIGASIASGSYPSSGMIVLPCSMGTLAAIAQGLANTLIARAADVTLKERRRLVLLVREAPLHAAHLRNMQEVTQMGGIVFPPVPAFYHRPRSIEEMVDQTLARVLDLIGVEHQLAPRWRGVAAPESSPGT